MRLLVGSYSWTKLLSQREVRGEVKGMGVGSVMGTILTCQNKYLCFVGVGLQPHWCYLH